MRKNNFLPDRLFLFAALIISLSGCVRNFAPPLRRGEFYQRESERLLEKSKAQYQAALSDPESAGEARLKLARVYFLEGDYARTIEFLGDYEKLHPDYLRLLALAHYRLNNLPRARQIYERWEELEPKALEAQYYLGIIKEKQNVFEQAVKHYQRIISQAPESEFAGKARHKLAGIEAKGKILTLADVEDGEVKRLIREAPTKQGHPNAGAAILLDEIKIVIHPDNTKTTTIHKLIKILDDRGKGFGEVEVDFDSTYQTVKVDFARTVKGDGTIVPVSKKAWRELSPWSGFPLYSNAKTLIISMPEIMVGAVIEYQVTITSSHLITKGDFQFSKYLQSHEPKYIQRIILTIPEDRSWLVKFIRNEKVKPLVEREGKNITYQWEIKNIPQIIPESMMPPWGDILPMMMISSFDSWEKISSWFSGLSSGQLKPDEEIRQKVAELTAGRNSSRDKAREIFHWVAPQIRYVGLEYGVSGYKPHAVAEIFRNKYGDCKDQASLLVSMLRQAGIKAYLVLINTQDSGRVIKDIPMLQFNHCIAVADIDGEYIWLDPTYKTCSFGYLPSEDQDREVLVFFDDGARFVRTPFLEAEKNKIVEKETLEIQMDGSVRGRSDVFTSGCYNKSYRHLKYVSPDKRERMLQSMVNGDFPGGELLDYSFSDLDDLNQPVKISLTYRGPDYLKKAGDLRLFQLAGVGGSATKVGLETRVYPIFFGESSWSQDEVLIKIPAAYKVKYLPPGLDLELPAVSYSAKYELVDDVTIRYQQKYIVKGREIPVAGYNDYKLFVEKIAKFGEESIVLEVR